MSATKKDLDRLRKDAQRTAHAVRLATEAARTQTTELREQIGTSELITADAVVAIVGSDAIVLSHDNINASAVKFGQAIVRELVVGDVVWRIGGGVPNLANDHVCAVLVARKAGVICRGLPPILVSEGNNDDNSDNDNVRKREGSLQIVSGHLILHGGKRFNMVTAQRLE